MVNLVNIKLTLEKFGKEGIHTLRNYPPYFTVLFIHSVHPYIFFNERAEGTITFVGFRVTPEGNLVHPINGQLLEAGIMSTDLFTGLQQNGVNFSEDYTRWGKTVMVQKLCSVMGVAPFDPDESYVLTMDNVIKILAIHMRFRYVLIFWQLTASCQYNSHEDMFGQERGAYESI